MRHVRNLPVVAALSRVVRGISNARASSEPTVQSRDAWGFAIAVAFIVLDDCPAIRTDGVGVAGCRQADVFVWAGHQAAFRSL